MLIKQYFTRSTDNNTWPDQLMLVATKDHSMAQRHRLIAQIGRSRTTYIRTNSFSYNASPRCDSSQIQWGFVSSQEFREIDHCICCGDATNKTPIAALVTPELQCISMHFELQVFMSMSFCFQTHFSLQKLQQIPSVLVRVFFAENDLLFDIQTKSFRRKVTDFLT